MTRQAVTSAGRAPRAPAVAHPPRLLLAGLVAPHGLAQLAGTSDAFHRASDGAAVQYVAGGGTISDPTAPRALGLVWAVAAVAFLAAAIMTRVGAARWPSAVGGVAAGSRVVAVAVVAAWRVAARPGGRGGARPQGPHRQAARAPSRHRALTEARR